MARSRSVEKRLLRKRRAIVLEARYQRLRTAIRRGALFAAGAVAVILPLQLLDLPVPAGAPPGALQQPILRHYALVLALLPTGYFAAVFVFRFLAHRPMMSAIRLLSLGAVFAVASYLSYIAALSFAGLLGGIVWLTVLALVIAFAGDRLPHRGMR